MFYFEQMLADADSYGPSATQPRTVLAAWREARLPVEIHNVVPATEADLCLVHHPVHVRDALAGTAANGVGNTVPDLARSLPDTTGAKMASARAALDTGCACAPVRGFVHAGYRDGAGFCTFNDLIVAARKLPTAVRLRHVPILDCDMHYGDDTDGIIGELRLAQAITRARFGRWLHPPDAATAGLDTLRETVADFDPFDVVPDQAGADPHIDDPLVGMLTTGQMRERVQRFLPIQNCGVPYVHS